MVNFNNPQQLSLSNSYSTVSNILESPFVKHTPDYGDFSSADPTLASLLPTNLNLGITSPGTIHMETECDGLDFVNTNPDFNKLPFSACLQKFGEQYKIPEMVFNNLMNNLPYTFSGLSSTEKTKYLQSLQKFIDKETDIKNKVQIKENLENLENLENTGGNESSENSKCCLCNGNKLTNIIYIVIASIILFVFILFITNKK